ncbi:restriction endonuclease subunit S [Anaerovibrio lipolyticus]|uniref:restriction endonuclease subunit S n=1 Tax=Anaerovibrio lipolyticus TaxID=82374 RepID=UPI000685129A|nr:restriction endonuclease subunit S [Anaerovibrio lipolyticus]
MMTAQQLKNSILQRAIEGKLVEQRAEEGTAKELLKEIKLEKEKLVKEGKIKKSKPLQAITEDEIPFEIPDSWEWCKLGEIVFNRGQKKPDTTFCYIDIGSIDNIHQQLNVTENIIEPTKAPSRARKIVEMGDILYSTVRPYLHNMCIVNRDFSHEPIASTGFATLTCTSGIFNKFLFYYLLSPEFDRYANSNENAKGVAYPAINDGRLYNSLVPLPPLSEQHRIVAKIEELLPLVDQYDKAYSQLTVLNEKFPQDMKKSILQYAIEGKLVEQRAEEGTAKDLLKEINLEKEKLIKEGKIKKSKPLPPITEDEIPFDIPEGWEWVRFEDYTLYTTDYVANGSFKSLRENVKTFKNKEYAILVKTQDFANNFTNDLTYTNKEGYEFLQKSRLYGGELMLSNIGASIGKAFIVPKLEHPMTLAPNSIMVKCLDEITTFYLRYLMLAYYGQNILKEFTAGTAMPKFSKTQLRSCILPIPPYQEQKRIVTKIEELMPLCDKLSKTK